MRRAGGKADGGLEAASAAAAAASAEFFQTNPRIKSSETESNLRRQFNPDGCANRTTLTPSPPKLLSGYSSQIRTTLVVISVALITTQSGQYFFAMKTVWNILLPLTVITAGTYNSLRPAIATVGWQTVAVGLFSLKALRHTTKIPRYSWYGLRLLITAPFKLMGIQRRQAKTGTRSRRNQARLKRRAYGTVLSQEESSNVDDDDDDDEGALDPCDGDDADRMWVESRHRDRPSQSKSAKQRKFVAIYRTIPLRLVSRVWGRLMQLPLPKPLRKPVFLFFASVTGCNLDEVRLDVSAYASLGEFFRRQLKPESRPIDEAALVTSPADGTVVTAGRVESGELEQIKGVTYSLHEFLGHITWNLPLKMSTTTTVTMYQAVTMTATTTLTTTTPQLTNFDIHKDSTPPNDAIDPEPVETAVQAKTQTPDQTSLWIEMAGLGRVSPERTEVSTPFPDAASTMKVSMESPEDTVGTPASTRVMVEDDDDDDVQVCRQYRDRLCLKPSSTHRLYHLVVYLAPGDYHRFHSPVDWTVTYRRHVPGDLFSVSPRVSRLIAGLFNLNERVVYAGFWRHGFFSLTAVGATGVGSIRTRIDPALSTNQWKWDPRKEAYLDRDFVAESGSGVPVRKGEEFGEFNLGSTIVLIFEAPIDFRFRVCDGKRVKFGQGVGVGRGALASGAVEPSAADAGTALVVDQSVCGQRLPSGVGSEEAYCDSFGSVDVSTAAAADSAAAAAAAADSAAAAAAAADSVAVPVTADSVD